MSVTFHPRVELVTRSGSHLRYVTRSFAEALVSSGSAQPEPGAGKVRSVALTRPASSHAERIGDPTTARAPGVRFYRWQNLDCGARVVEHHPRCTILNLDDA